MYAIFQLNAYVKLLGPVPIPLWKSASDFSHAMVDHLFLCDIYEFLLFQVFIKVITGKNCKKKYMERSQFISFKKTNMILPLDHFQASVLIFLSLTDHSSLCSIHLNLHLARSSHILILTLAFQEKNL